MQVCMQWSTLGMRDLWLSAAASRWPKVVGATRLKAQAEEVPEGDQKPFRFFAEEYLQDLRWEAGPRREGTDGTTILQVGNDILKHADPNPTYSVCVPSCVSCQAHSDWVPSCVQWEDERVVLSCSYDGTIKASSTGSTLRQVCRLCEPRAVQPKQTPLFNVAPSPLLPQGPFSPSHCLVVTTAGGRGSFGRQLAGSAD